MEHTQKFNVSSGVVNVTFKGDISDMMFQPIVYLIRFGEDKLYIGATKRLYGRIEDHIKKIARGNTPVARALVKYKDITVECLAKCDSVPEAKHKERWYIHQQAKITYNQLARKRTNYRSYAKYRDIINQVLLNRNCL